MAEHDTIRQSLLQLAQALGSPQADCAILGEGNVSARMDAGRFWIKASGTRLGTLAADDLVAVDHTRVLALLKRSDLDDSQVIEALGAARCDPAAKARPSVETVMHAVCLSLEDVHFVGHTHPTPINSILCAKGFDQAVAGRLFPDEIVVCGPAPLVIPYVDPGLPLARAVRDGIEDYVQTYGQSPRVILLQNHGLVALGQSARQVEDITAMAVKTARILLGAHALGGPRFLTQQQVDRIHTRPDEHYRQRVLGIER